MYDNIPFPEVLGSPVPVVSPSVPDGFYYQGYQTPVPDIPVSPDVSILPESSMLPSETILPDVLVSPEPSLDFDGLFKFTDDMSLMSQNFEELAAGIVATQGYMNTNVIDMLDRVVAVSKQPYYIAYRYDNDSYNAYLYMCYDYSGERDALSLQDTTFVQIYRYRPSLSGNYEYLYSVQELGEVELNVGDYSMMYTNIFPGYPSLGTKASQDNFGNTAGYIMVFLVVAMMFFIFRIFRRN